MNAPARIEPPLNVYQRLNAARAAFHATKLKKTGKNTFANYNYFELGDFLIPALQIFKDQGLCAKISFTADLATMTIVNVDEPADCMEITSPMGSANLKGCHEVQNVGAVETYQRRYLWVAALEIVEHDALDATTGRDEGQSQEGTVSPQPSEPKARKASAHSALKTAYRQFIHEANGCGDGDELSAFLATADSVKLVAEIREKLPHIWDGENWPEGQERPAEWETLSDFITRRQRECAEASAQYLTA